MKFLRAGFDAVNGKAQSVPHAKFTARRSRNQIVLVLVLVLVLENRTE
jgi:hypothetical protein